MEILVLGFVFLIVGGIVSWVKKHTSMWGLSLVERDTLAARQREELARRRRVIMTCVGYTCAPLLFAGSLSFRATPETQVVFFSAAVVVPLVVWCTRHA